jgi:hypothetical protein
VGFLLQQKGVSYRDRSKKVPSPSAIRDRYFVSVAKGGGFGMNAAGFGLGKNLPSRVGAGVVRSSEVYLPKAAYPLLRAVSQRCTLDDFADNGLDGDASLPLHKHFGGSGI